MPRHPANNPIERLDRLLPEIEGLLVAYNALWEAAQRYMPWAEIDALPSAPPMIEFEKEKVRQQTTYSRARAARASMELQRARGGSKRDMRAQAQAQDDAYFRQTLGQTRTELEALTPEDIERLLAEDRAKHPEEYASPSLSADPKARELREKGFKLSAEGAPPDKGA